MELTILTNERMMCEMNRIELTGMNEWIMLFLVNAFYINWVLVLNERIDWMNDSIKQINYPIKRIEMILLNKLNGMNKWIEW